MSSTSEQKDGARLESARQRVQRLKQRMLAASSASATNQKVILSGGDGGDGGGGGVAVQGAALTAPPPPRVAAPAPEEPTNLAIRPIVVRPQPVQRPVPLHPQVQVPQQQQQQQQQQRTRHVLHRPTPMRNNSWHPGAASISNSRTASGRLMRSAASLERKYKKPSWYHQVAAKNRLGSIHEDAFVDDEEDGGEKTQHKSRAAHPSPQQQQQQPAPSVPACTQQAKQELLDELNSTGGESNTPTFHAALQKLVSLYDSSHFDPRRPVPRYATACVGNQLEGIGISAGKPTFPGCIGRNDAGDPMYKLGTMSFDMFCPTQLVVSVQGTFVLIDTVDGRNPQGVKNVPKHLLADVRFGRSPVRTYDIVTPFTIEPWKPEFGEDSPNKGIEQPIRGVLTNYGFILPYPTQNRFSVWFTGGSLEVDDQKNEKWFQIFDKDAAHSKRTAAEADKVAMAKRLLGASTNNNDEMDQDGKLTYSMSNPQASHIDLLYLDKTLQVLRGSSGTVYVHVRLPGSKAVQDSFRSPISLLPSPISPLQQLTRGGLGTGGGGDHVGKKQHHQLQHSDQFDPYSSDYGGNIVLFPSLRGPPERRGVRKSFSASNVIQAMALLQLSPPPPPPQGVVPVSTPEGHLQELQAMALPQQQPPQRRVSTPEGRLQELQSFVVEPQQPPPQRRVSTPEARLQELESFVVEQQSAPFSDDGTKRSSSSCLKKTSSYGESEELGTNIPISHEPNAWMALPQPKSKATMTISTTEVPKKKTSNVWRRFQLKRTQSDSHAIKQGMMDDTTESSSNNDLEEELNEMGNKKDSSSSAPKRPQLRKTVSFSSLEIRDYTITVGDNPACSSGLPVSLDWSYDPQTRTIPISNMDSIGNGRQDNSGPWRMTATERKLKLRKEFGVEMDDIELAALEAERVRQQRDFTNRYRSTPSSMKVEETLESVQRKAKRVVGRFQKPRPKAGVAGVA